MNLPESGEDPVSEESPLNLILYMHLRIFAYSSNILMASFDPMDSMLMCDIVCLCASCVLLY